MPHYRNGRPMHVGDCVVGKPINTPNVVSGTVTSIYPDSETCGLQVQYTVVQPIGLDGYIERPRMAVSDPVVRRSEKHGAEGSLVAIFTCVDYGNSADFTFVCPRSGCEDQCDVPPEKCCKPCG